LEGVEWRVGFVESLDDGNPHENLVDNIIYGFGDSAHLKIGVQETFGKVCQRISLHKMRKYDAIVGGGGLFAKQQVDEQMSISQDWLDLKISLQAGFDDGLIETPIATVRADDIVSSVFGEDAIRNFLLIACLCVCVFILEDLGDERRAMDQNVPTCPKEDLHGSVLLQWGLEVPSI
jgi:hypothetical protein